MTTLVKVELDTPSIMIRMQDSQRVADLRLGPVFMSKESLFASFFVGWWQKIVRTNDSTVLVETDIFCFHSPYESWAFTSKVDIPNGDLLISVHIPKEYGFILDDDLFRAIAALVEECFRDYEVVISLEITQYELLRGQIHSVPV